MAPLTVATFNVHWGRGSRRDRWPRFDVIEACRALDADVIALQETWAPDAGAAQHDEVAEALGLDVRSVATARAVLHPEPKLISRAGPDRSAGDGSWCVAILSRLPITTTRSIELPDLRFDPWSRVLLEVGIQMGSTPMTIVATHFSHLEMGSVRHARPLRRALPPVGQPAVFLGDMNMWGWTIAAMTPEGWRRAVQGKTWPAHRPAHQIDHILVTPSVEVSAGGVLPDLGSDHRALRARLVVP